MSALRAAVLAIACAGCAADDGPALTVSPSHASLFGHTDVEIRGDLRALGEIQHVTIAGLRAYDLRRVGDVLTVRLQGAFAPGPADLVVAGPERVAVQRGALTFDPPVAGVPLVWGAFGASLTQGVQSGGVDWHTQLQSPAAMLARAAGVYLGVPILADGMVLPLSAADFDAGCAQKAGSGAGLSTFTDQLVDPTTGELDLRRGRLDWMLPHRNHAIGRAKVRHTLHGMTGPAVVLSNIVENPAMDPSGLLSEEEVSQIERIEALDPDVGICTDLLANDLDPAVAQKDDVHPELNTPLEEVRPLLDEMMARLGRLHGHYFFSNMPSPTRIPNMIVVRDRRMAEARDTAESFAAKLAVIDVQTTAYNAALAEAIAPYPNLHLIDFAGAVEARYTAGIEVSGEHLGLQPFGGLFSLDHLHFSDVGFAVFTNELLPAINAALGTSIPPVDLALTHATDTMAPGQLRAAGLACAR